MQGVPRHAGATHRSWVCGRATVFAVLSAFLGLALILALVAAVLAKSSADHLAPTQVTGGDATIEVTFAPGDLAVSRTQVLDRVTTSAQAVAHYDATPFSGPSRTNPHHPGFRGARPLRVQGKSDDT